jgi:tetratricopeptide (TPR) repeat protein
VQIHEAPGPASPTALHQLPRPPADFTGREAELNELLANIEDGGVSISGLRGMGGVGKTALALKLAERLTSRYPDAQLYLDLRGNSKQPLAPTDAMTHVVRSFHPSMDPPKTDAELAGTYRSVLHGRRVLLLMDNAFNGGQVEPLSPPGSCAMLVTSRQHFTLPGMFIKNIDPLCTNDAVDYLQKAAPRIGSDADGVARLCGYLPLALTVIGSLLRNRPDLKPTDCIYMLEDSPARLKLLDALELSFRLSFQLLTVELQRLWCASSVFEGGFELCSAAAVWNVEISAARDAIGELLKYSLVDWNEPTARYRLHDLARLFADHWQDGREREQAKKRHAAFYLGLLQEADTLYQQGGEERTTRAVWMFDQDWSNIEAGQSWSQSNGDLDLDALKFCSVYAGAGTSILWLRRHSSELVAWFDGGIRAAEKLGDKAALGRHLVNLGRSYYLLDGNPERAMKLYLQGLAIARAVGDQAGEGQALGNLGVIYRESGESDRAIEIFEGRLKIARGLKDKRGESSTLGNLGRTYWTVRNLDRSIGYCNEQLKIAREIGDRGNEARALGNLAQSYSQLEEYPRAIELSKQSLVIQQQLGNRRAQGGALGDLGRTYQRSGQLELAKECYERSLEIQREVGYRRGEGSALGNLGRVYKDLGDTNRSLDCHKRRLAIAQETNDSVTEARVLFDMSFVFRALEDYENAIGCAEKALKIFEGLKDPLVVKVGRQLDRWRSRVAQRKPDG